MNQQIWKIKEQAKVLAEKDITPQVYDTYGEYKCALEEMITTEFAKLIVEKCLELNKKELSFTAYARMYERYAEHFGIEPLLTKSYSPELCGND